MHVQFPSQNLTAGKPPGNIQSSPFLLWINGDLPRITQRMSCRAWTGIQSPPHLRPAQSQVRQHQFPSLRQPLKDFLRTALFSISSRCAHTDVLLPSIEELPGGSVPQTIRMHSLLGMRPDARLLQAGSQVLWDSSPASSLTSGKGYLPACLTLAY